MKPQNLFNLVIRQSLHSLPWWRTEPEAANWFLHHTILKSREAGEMPSPKEIC